jgi:hypothetical protein
MVRVDAGLLDRTAKAVENFPGLHLSAGRIPSPAWIRIQVDELRSRARDEQHLIDMVVARRMDMTARIMGA